MVEKTKQAMRRAIPSIPHTPYSIRPRGFTLLLAALIASIVMALGGSIFTIAQKQVTLSSIGRDSQFAFYAADTAAECALYWDIRFEAFATSTVIAATCDGMPITMTGKEPTPPYTVSFQVDLFTDTSGGYCADVTVEKRTTDPYTIIHADGYSTPCATIESSARSLQRSVELQY